MISTLQLDASKITNAAEEMIREYGDEALTKTDDQVKKLKSQGFASVAPNWALLRAVIKDLQQSDNQIRGYEDALNSERAMGALGLQLRDYRLTTAEILYHLPDHPHLLQSYLWQEYDLAPNFPTLRRFLDFWARNLDGRLHSVKVAGQQLIQAPEARYTSAYLRLQ